MGRGVVFRKAAVRVVLAYVARTLRGIVAVLLDQSRNRILGSVTLALGLLLVPGISYGGCKNPCVTSPLDLGTFGGNFSDRINSEAQAVTAKGDVVVGSSLDADGVSHAFLWQDGTLIDLGFGSALDISNNGRVVVGVDGSGHAFRWTAVSVSLRIITSFELIFRIAQMLPSGAPKTWLNPTALPIPAANIVGTCGSWGTGGLPAPRAGAQDGRSSGAIRSKTHVFPIWAELRTSLEIL